MASPRSNSARAHRNLLPKIKVWLKDDIRPSQDLSGKERPARMLSWTLNIARFNRLASSIKVRLLPMLVRLGRGVRLQYGCRRPYRLDWKCESGGIGRRTRLRIWRGNPWGFESPLSHQEFLRQQREKAAYGISQWDRLWKKLGFRLQPQIMAAPTPRQRGDFPSPRLRRYTGQHDQTRATERQVCEHG
jgi:hypothetical protein